MISNNCNNLSVDVGIPWKKDSTHVVTPFFHGIPPSTEKLLQLFLNILHDTLSFIVSLLTTTIKIKLKRKG